MFSCSADSRSVGAAYSIDILGQELGLALERLGTLNRWPAGGLVEQLWYPKSTMGVVVLWYLHVPRLFWQTPRPGCPFEFVCLWAPARDAGGNGGATTVGWRTRPYDRVIVMGLGFFGCRLVLCGVKKPFELRRRMGFRFRKSSSSRFGNEEDGGVAAADLATK
ncbi:hypothetical protein NE237_031152 [Protea cynaroides]|uniref:Uncharacterized protein n=1 Tax=Protea cynaroides TaxID=273540 RepID=A0A9Q0L125_9MAGN|nr:hypothetical protein NE237_031152 [Protea cynaroides]